MNMDRELTKALERSAVPPGFTERAVARVKLAAARRSWSFRGVSRIAAALTVVTLTGLGGYRYVEHRKARQAENASQQLLLALQITAEKASMARRAINPGVWK